LVVQLPLAPSAKKIEEKNIKAQVVEYPFQKSTMNININDKQFVR